MHNCVLQCVCHVCACFHPCLHNSSAGYMSEHLDADGSLCLDVSFFMGCQERTICGHGDHFQDGGFTTSSAR